MSKMKKMIGLFSLIFTVSAVKAQAGVLFEPMLTYERGSTSIDYSSSLVGNSSGSLNGFGFGARLGAHASDIVFLTLDARYSKPQFKDSSFDLSSDATSLNYGPSIGVQMPIVGLRLLGTYVLGGELNPGESKGVDYKFSEAKGTRVGLGFQIVAVSVNLEYQDLEYGKTDVEQVGPITGVNGDGITLKDKAYILSASFPLNL